MTTKDHVETALKELVFARCNPEDCEDNHTEEYRNETGNLEHTDFHIDNAISELNIVKKDLEKQ